MQLFRATVIIAYEALRVKMDMHDDIFCSRRSLFKIETQKDKAENVLKQIGYSLIMSIAIMLTPRLLSNAFKEI